MNSQEQKDSGPRAIFVLPGIFGQTPFSLSLTPPPTDGALREQPHPWFDEEFESLAGRESPEGWRATMAPGQVKPGAL